MQFATIRQLKNQTSKILEQSHQGRDVVITRHGSPLALLVSVDEESLEDFILVKHFNLERAFLGAKKAHRQKKLPTLDQKIASLRKDARH
ncbi:MAG: type II toxin-antitoxin system Phd/YefM family antitoxin [Deltaproteobacteria bacterium]|nr:type II toxin-antitoxin system Phd/YefM family antitoxin [Deltaproteobacteria bacterium]